MTPVFHQRIQRKYAKLTRSQAALSRYVMANSEEVPFLSSSELARRVQVSDATVTRFCLALGYTGYADFQKDMQKWVQQKLTPSQRFEKTRRKQADLSRRIFHRDIQNLQETLETLSFANLESAGLALGRARRIYIIGLRTSFSLASLAYYHLSRIGRNVVLLDGARGLLYDPLIDIRPEDAVLAISFPRYSKETLEVARYAKDQGTRVIAVTDSILSPLAQTSDLVIEVKTESLSFFASFTSGVCVVNCLCALVSLANPGRSKKALKEIEARLRPLGTWIV